MKISSNLDSYPVFPNWAFTGKIPVTDNVVKQILTSVPGNTQESEKNKLTQETYQLSQVMGSMFFDTVRSHYRLPKNLQHIESVDAHFIDIKPTYNLSLRVNRHRWYQGAVFLQCDKDSSDIYLDMLDSKLYSTPPGVQEYQHVIEAEYLKVAFWPAHIPWGMTVNSSNQNTTVFTTSFIIKR